MIKHLIIFLIVIVSTNITFGQESHEITAEATVLQALNLNSLQEVNFGIFIQDISSGAPFINATDNSSYNILQGNPTRGILHITGTSNSNINIITDNIVSLSNGIEELVLTTNVAYIPGNDQSSTNALEINNPETLNTSGEGLVFIGGVLSAGTGNTPENLVSGQYVGSVNITVEYFDL